MVYNSEVLKLLEGYERDEDARHARHPAVPERTREAVDRYVLMGVMPGRFTQSVLANNLVGAVMAADQNNLRALPSVVAYVVQEIPGFSWGNSQRLLDYCREVRHLRDTQSSPKAEEVER